MNKKYEDVSQETLDKEFENEISFTINEVIMTTLLDGYADALAELLDEKISLNDAYEQVADTITEEGISFEDVVIHFAKVYEATTEEYADNIAEDDGWAIKHDLVGVHFDDELETRIIDEEFDSQ